MTLEAIENKVRLVVNDTQLPYRFTQFDIFGFIVGAVRHLRNINPSERYDPDTGLVSDTYPQSLEPDEEIRFDPRHEEAVILYAAHKVYQLDMTDTVNLQISENLKARAETLMQL